MRSIPDILDTIKKNNDYKQQIINLYNSKYLTYENENLAIEKVTNVLKACIRELKQHDPVKVHAAIITAKYIDIVGKDFVNELQHSVQCTTTELETLLATHRLILAKGKYLSTSYCIEEQMYLVKLSSIVVTELPNVLSTFEGNFGNYRSAINSMLLSLPILRNLQNADTVYRELQANLRTLDTSDSKLTAPLLASVEIGKETNLVTFKSKEIMDMLHPAKVNSSNVSSTQDTNQNEYKGFAIVVTSTGFTSPSAGITKEYQTLSGIQSAIRAKHK